MEEKRKFVRIPGDKIRLKVRTFVEGTDSNFYNVDNLSAGGLLFLYNYKLKIGDYVLLTIDPFEIGINHLIKCVANVNRVEKNDEVYNTALKFERISKDDIYYLNTIVYT